MTTVIHTGDCIEVLRRLPDASVQCVITSPPYYGLRDYGTGEAQIGLEDTPDAYVARLVDVFREVRRVLRPHGSLWLNLGDSYAGGCKPKDLLGIPWLVAFALRADGWYLRSDIVWAKPNPMPESVRDRPTKAHEYVFLLTKGPRYYFDQEAVREPHTTPGADRNVGKVDQSTRPRPKVGDDPMMRTNGRNVRSVWTIATQPFPEAHFATFPEELPRRCIEAGCPVQVDAETGEARERIVRSTRTLDGVPVPDAPAWSEGGGPTERARRSQNDGRGHWRWATDREALGWTGDPDRPYVPGTVLDPFLGSGTTALVARKLGRRCVGIDLSAEYLGIAARRTAQLSLLTFPDEGTTTEVHR